MTAEKRVVETRAIKVYRAFASLMEKKYGKNWFYCLNEGENTLREVIHGMLIEEADKTV